MCLDLNKYTVLFFVAAARVPENSCETNPSEYVYNSVHKSKRVRWKREKEKNNNCNTRAEFANERFGLKPV